MAGLGATEEAAGLEGEAALVTQDFLEQLFTVIREDLATLKQEIAFEVKELKRDIGELGQRVDSIEQTHNTHEKELDNHGCKLLLLQHKNLELQYHMEDLDTRSRRSNICSKGVPMQAISGSLVEFAVHLFRHVAPALKGQDILLDCIHRAGHLARSPGQAQDNLMCQYCYKQKEAILSAV
ncbi:hypothetical protein NDU88_002318 [Pleurodeles waltl]|uniref:Uncharacterized protein n=1 Tax=Pleurodeles waltl TaxID=8319 RepID=A0AAV7M150_PLEWA|nr:hypothetical protein NDU88_002318 [Pleurodeles waltl]